MLKKWIVRGMLALAMPTAIAVCVKYLEADAYVQAHTFCERFPPGSRLADAESAAVRDVGDKSHKLVRAPNKIMVLYMGVPPFSRHTCVLEANAGRVIRSQYVHFD